MVITTGTILSSASLFGAACVLLGAVFKIHSWYLKQEQQDAEIASIKAELEILSKGMLASLDGLEQLGCNHIVPQTRIEFEDHINKKAHK